MGNNARMDERKKGIRKDLLKTKADVEKEGKEPAAVSVTFVRISTKMYFYEPKHNNSSMMTLSNSSIVFVRLEEIERFFFFWSVIFPD
jgi:hypothetical protein